MSKVAVTKEKLDAIGDALREKREESIQYGLDEMPQVIRDIKSGGDDSFISGVNMPSEFRYEGEVIKEYLYYKTSNSTVKSIDLPNVKDIGQFAFWINVQFNEHATIRINMP